MHSSILGILYKSSIMMTFNFVRMTKMRSKSSFFEANTMKAASSVMDSRITFVSGLSIDLFFLNWRLFGQLLMCKVHLSIISRLQVNTMLCHACVTKLMIPHEITLFHNLDDLVAMLVNIWVYADLFISVLVTFRLLHWCESWFASGDVLFHFQVLH